MKTKIIGILVIMLLITTALPVIGVITEKEKFNFDRVQDKSLLNHDDRNSMVTHRGGMFIQVPLMPDEFPFEWASDPNRQVLEDFWQLPHPICDIHWWGEYVLYEGGVWSPLDPNLMRVNISIYDDVGGQPGTEVASYINVKPTVTSTGIWYDWGDPFLWQLYYFEYVLDPCVPLSQGWVSISSVASSDNGWLLWITSPDGNDKFLRNESGTMVSYDEDMALVLTDGQPAEPDLDCDGELSWIDVPPGKTVSGDFAIRNNGDDGSILHWKIDEYPNWGTNWTCLPNASILTKDIGWITVDVSVEAPPEKNQEFTGDLKLINIEDPSDYCIIPVILKTPYNNAMQYQFNLIEWLVTRFPHAFSILRNILEI